MFKPNTTFQVQWNSLSSTLIIKKKFDKSSQYGEKKINKNSQYVEKNNKNSQYVEKNKQKFPVRWKK